jgi:hypothetical protein
MDGSDHARHFCCQAEALQGAMQGFMANFVECFAPIHERELPMV